MPAKGKHRRPKSRRFTRSIAVAGTGGAACALPLMGATGAHAAAPAAVAEKAASTAPVAPEKAATHADGARTYTVKPGDWFARIADEQHISGGWQRLYEDNRSVVGSDPSLIHPGLRLTLDGERAASAPATPSATDSESSAPRTPATATTGFTLPVAGAVVGTGYHVAGGMWSSGYHTGVDFDVPTGTGVKAIAAGTVVSAGWGGSYGNQVVIKLADGYYAQYAHLSQISVAVGQSVTAGQQIGLSGATGNVTGPHLHVEIRTTPDYGSDVDPVAYLRSHGLSVG